MITPQPARNLKISSHAYRQYLNLVGLDTAVLYFGEIAIRKTV